jgi:hypothetical protein
MIVDEVTEKVRDYLQSPEYKAEVAAQKAQQATCLHTDYNFKNHGRCCPKCGAVMVDWGD